MERKVSTEFLNRLWNHQTPPCSDLVELFRPQYHEIDGIIGRDILCIIVRIGSRNYRYHNIEGITVDPKNHTLSFEFRHRRRLRVTTCSLEPAQTDIIFLTVPQRQTVV